MRESSSAPLPVVQLQVESGEEGPLVTGRVLTLGQARGVRQLAAAHHAGVDIEVLADPKAGLEQGWLEISGDGPLEVWRDPARIGEDHARQTEYLPADGPLRQLGSLDAALLLQGPDLSVGWSDGARLVASDPAAGRRVWDQGLRARAGEAVLPDAARAGSQGDGGLLDRLTQALRAELGVGYRWGGTTHLGFDCSGLVQRAFSEATGVLLPKHTSDQRRVGARVIGGDAEPGDLLFATPRGQRVGHVMVLSTPNSVLHACRTEMKVIEEPLSANALRYQHQGYRRPVVLGA